MGVNTFAEIGNVAPDDVESSERTRAKAQAGFTKSCNGNCDKPQASANTYTVIENKLALEALNDNIIVLEDKFKTGYECNACNGTGDSTETCSLCNGTKFEADGSSCRACRNGRNMQSSGFKPCKECNGTGAKGGIIVPEISERRPTTGKVVSCGPEVKVIKPGMHILYTNYNGHAINYKNKVVIRMMKEQEVLAKMFKVATCNPDWRVE